VYRALSTQSANRLLNATQVLEAEALVFAKVLQVARARPLSSRNTVRREQPRIALTMPATFHLLPTTL
jgi:hypothetical protein